MEAPHGIMCECISEEWLCFVRVKTLGLACVGCFLRAPSGHGDPAESFLVRSLFLLLPPVSFLFLSNLFSFPVQDVAVFQLKEFVIETLFSVCPLLCTFVPL